MNILGLSAFYHDAAAALVCDGRVVAAAQEERFTRRKHDESFPLNAIAYCLHEGQVSPGGLDAVVYYDKPVSTFGRLLSTYLSVGPGGFASFRRSMPVWLREKLWIPYQIERGLARLGHRVPDVHFIEHHESHAASAFFPSPFERAAILCFDGVGEWATASIGLGDADGIELIEQMNYPHSIGLLYSAFTQYCGFRVNSGEYKLMGLAPFGQPTFYDTIVEHLVDLREDGTIDMDMRYFGYRGGLSMINRRFEDLLGGPGRVPESSIRQRDADIAASIQKVTEDIVLRMAHHAAARTGASNAVLAGGVALNCVANSRLLREGPFDEVWVQPAAGDAGGALGAALYGWNQIIGGDRVVEPNDGMGGCYLGPSFTSEDIAGWLLAEGIDFVRLAPGTRSERAAKLVAEGKVVALFQGRMEFGPRALGNRSIIADARDPTMQHRLNQAIKFRESFRPFAPAVLAERASEWFDAGYDSPYMTLTAAVVDSELVVACGGSPADLAAWTAQVRSSIPAVTHVDNSARLQTVDKLRAPEFHKLLVEFDRLTGCPIVINTSFNVRGEPIVCTPNDAYDCFKRTGIDALFLEDLLVTKGSDDRVSSTESSLEGAFSSRV